MTETNQHTQCSNLFGLLIGEWDFLWHNFAQGKIAHEVKGNGSSAASPNIMAFMMFLSALLAKKPKKAEFTFVLSRPNDFITPKPMSGTPMTATMIISTAFAPSA